MVKIENKRQYIRKRPQTRSIEEILESSLYKELEAYQEAGIPLWLNGQASTSFGIANYVREEADFMRDYYLDQNNEICGVGFDQIRKTNNRQHCFPVHKT